MDPPAPLSRVMCVSTSPRLLLPAPISCSSHKERSASPGALSTHGPVPSARFPEGMS